MLIPGLVSATFKDRCVDDVIDIALASSLRAIEWSENHHFDPTNLSFVASLGEKTRKSGLEIASYGSYFRLGKDMDFSVSLNACVAMGADVMRIWGGDKPSLSLTKEERDALCLEAKSVAEQAKEKGITCALEWHKNTVTDSNESGLDFVESVGKDNFALFWQPTPMQSVSYRAQGLRSIGKYLKNLHVYYWDESGRRPLSEGRSDWKEYFSAVEGDHYALLEFVKDNSLEQFKEDAKTLLEWIK